MAMVKVHDLNSGVIRSKMTSPLIVEICRYLGINDRKFQGSTEIQRINFVIEILRNPNTSRKIEIKYTHQGEAKLSDPNFWNSSMDGVLTFLLEYQPGRFTAYTLFSAWRRIYGTDRGLGLTETFDIDWKEKVSFGDKEKLIEIISQARPQIMKWKPISSMAEAEHRRLQQSRISQFRSGSEIVDGIDVKIDSPFLAASNKVFMVPTRLMSDGSWTINPAWGIGSKWNEETSRSAKSGNGPDMTNVKIPPFVAQPSHTPQPSHAPIKIDLQGRIGAPASPKSTISEPEELESEDLRNADFFGVDLSGWSFHRCDLRGVRFDGAVLTSGRITQCNVEGASFRGANLQGVRFHGQWFQSGVGPTIAGSEMANCDFEDADLTGALMAGVNLRGANFRNAILNGVDFRGINSAVPNGFEPKDADLSGAVFDGAKSDSSTIWPTDFSVGRTPVGTSPPTDHSVEQAKRASTVDDSSSDAARRFLQGQLNVSIEHLIEGTCTFVDVGDEGTLVFRVSNSFDRELMSVIESFASKLNSLAARLTWASRKGKDGLWEPVMVVGLGDPTQDQPPVVLGVVEVSDYRTSERCRSVIGQRLSVLPIETSNFYVLPPVLLWDGTFSQEGGHVGMKFGGAVVSSKALRPVHLDVIGSRSGEQNAQTRSMAQESVGAFRLSRFLPNFFLQDSVGGEQEGSTTPSSSPSAGIERSAQAQPSEVFRYRDAPEKVVRECVQALETVGVSCTPSTFEADVDRIVTVEKMNQSIIQQWQGLPEDQVAYLVAKVMGPEGVEEAKAISLLAQIINSKLGPWIS